MRCAACGYDITEPNALSCPNCGQPLLVATPLSPQGAVESAPQPMPAAPSRQPPRLSELLAPLPPVRQRKVNVVVPVIVGVALIGVVAGLLAIINGQENGLIAGAANSTAMASAPHTPVAVVAYQNTFASSANDWPLGQYCSYGSGGLHVSGGGCSAPAGSFQDVDVKVTVEQIRGSTLMGYGVIVRNAGNDVRYEVDIDGDSQWSAARCDGPRDQSTAQCTTLAPYTANAAIRGGLNTPNTIDVNAKGRRFIVTVNGVNVGTFDDSVYGEGQVGIIVNGSGECVFTDFVVTRYA